MSLFKNHKLKVEVVTVQGEEFTLTEPSALRMCEYWEFVEKEHATINDDSSHQTKNTVNVKVGLRLTAACLDSHFPNKSVDDIFKMLCEDLTDTTDVGIFITAADNISMPKTETEDTQVGNLDTD